MGEQAMVMSSVTARTPSDCANVEPGTVVRVVGRCTVKWNDVLVSPLESRQCVLYKAKVRRVNRDYGYETGKPLKEEKCVDFALTDDSGGCIKVRGADVRALLADGYAGYERAIGTASVGLSNLLERHGWIDWTEVTAKEAVFGVGEPVAALGVLTNGPQGLYLKPITPADIEQPTARRLKRAWTRVVANKNKPSGVLVSNADSHTRGLVAPHPVAVAVPEAGALVIPVTAEPAFE